MTRKTTGAPAGKVVFVGAGPGDPGMLTARATSVARSTSSRETSRRAPLTATAPREFCDSTWLPPTATMADSMR